MKFLERLSAWVQQNYETCLLASLSLFPLSAAALGLHWAAVLQLFFLSFVSAAALRVKALQRRALRVPPTAPLWLLVFVPALLGLVCSAIWPNINPSVIDIWAERDQHAAYWVSSTAFWVLCGILPLVLLAIITERRYRYKMARLRIAKRREQQSRWRTSKREVLAEWKKRLRWLAGVQHDMRQPLHALGLLMAHPALANKDDATQAVLLQVTSCQSWLQDLAENIMEATRLELGEHREQKLSTLSSMDVCRALAAWVGQLAQTKGLTFVLDVHDKPIVTDARRLKRVLGNLVFNAVEHTHQGGVELQYRFDEDECMHCFVVKDTGPGLAEHVLATDTPEPSSFGSDLPKTGIGLYVVKRLCNEMGWRLTVEGQVGGGTHIVLRFAADKATNTTGVV